MRDTSFLYSTSLFADSLIWDLGNGVRLYGDTISFVFDSVGQYEITLFAYNLSSGCAVVTCESANNISHIHHRQPLLLDENQINEWISGKHEISRILDDQISFYQVSKRVNSPKNNDEELLYKI